jgi:putative zinc finger/helix-turn-helix YgiT family protein
VITKPRTVVATDGTELTFKDKWSACKNCKQEFYSREQSMASSRAAADVKRKHEGLLGPSEIRAIRDKYRVTQVELEQILGTGPKTVVRWERGTVSQGKAVETLLTVLADHPDVFWGLAERRGVVRGPAWSPVREVSTTSADADREADPVISGRATGEWRIVQLGTQEQ